MRHFLRISSWVVGACILGGAFDAAAISCLDACKTVTTANATCCNAYKLYKSCTPIGSSTCLARYNSAKTSCSSICTADYDVGDYVVQMVAPAAPGPKASQYVFDGMAVPQPLLSSTEFASRQSTAFTTLVSKLNNKGYAVNDANNANSVWIDPFASDYASFSIRKGSSNLTSADLQAALGSAAAFTSATVRQGIVLRDNSCQAVITTTTQSGTSTQPSINLAQWGHDNQGGLSITDVDGRRYSAVADADINAPEGWKAQETLTTSVGRKKVLAVVIDDGFNISTSAQYSANLFNNSKEIACNNLDDDGDGAVDNVNGWDAVMKTGCLSQGALSEIASGKNGKGHGSHVASIIAAGPRKVSTDTIGVAPFISLYLIKAAQKDPVTGVASFSSDALADAYRHVLSLKNQGYEIAVVNASYGAPCSKMGAAEQQALNDLVNAGVTVVGAAGNDLGANNDVTPICPGNLGAVDTVPAGVQGVISVSAGNPGPQTASTTCGSSSSTATLQSGHNLLAWSNRGSNSVNAAAPGAVIYANGEFRSGSSQAAAYVSGVVALMKSVCPFITPAQIESILSDPANSKQYGWQVMSGGMVNAEKVLAVASSMCVFAKFSAGSPAGQVVTCTAGTNVTKSRTGPDGFAPSPAGCSTATDGQASSGATVLLSYGGQTCDPSSGTCNFIYEGK